MLEVASNALTIPSTRRAQPRTSSMDDSTPAVILARNADLTGEDEEKVSPQKRQRVDGYPVGPSTCSYWPKSPEAYQLFKPRKEYVSVYDSTQNLTTSYNDGIHRDSPGGA